MASTVVITGSSKGVGFVLADEFASRGWNVMISGRTTQAIDDAVTRIRTRTPQAKVAGTTLDVTSFESVQGLWDATVAAYGRVDLWINNAGLAISTKTIVENTPDEIRDMVTTNMIGTMFGGKVAATGLLQQTGGGRIINILGGGSDGKVRPGQGIYSSTKRGLDLFTKALVNELKNTRVRVGSVRPGILLTEGFVREAKELDPAEFAKQRKVLNIIGDKPETAAPWLVDQIVATSDKHGVAIAWLSTAKIIGRFSTAGFKKRDFLKDYGL